MKKILNLEYGAIHAFYWMSYAVIGSFASAFLLGRGYSNSFIGLIIAVGSVLAIFLQPVLADIADRSKNISFWTDGNGISPYDHFDFHFLRPAKRVGCPYGGIHNARSMEYGASASLQFHGV